MSICTNPKELRNAIAAVQPDRIAVAFIGINWQDYVDISSIEEIIISPTLGSNPRAVENIMDKLGEENVYFLDNLHAKIYLGKQQALVGSCNLTSNGFSDQGLYEMAAIIHDSGQLKRICDKFSEYKKIAKRAYPDKKSKENKLSELHRDWQKAIEQKLISNLEDNENHSITSGISKYDRIHVMWFDSNDLEIDVDEAITKKPQLADQGVDNYFEQFITALETDQIEPGDWILIWKRRKDRYASCKHTPFWVYVHEIINKIVISNENYTKLVGQVANRDIPPEPFTIDSRTARAFFEVINSGNFPELISTDDKDWQLPTVETTNDFLTYLEYRVTEGS